MNRIASVIAPWAIVCLFANPVSAADQPSEKPAWWYKDVVDATYVAQYATVPPKKNVLIVDSRPARKYNKYSNFRCWG